jgi:uncharacterized membrane protein YphA (DoxX/SURF4 family)
MEGMDGTPSARGMSGLFPGREHFLLAARVILGGTFVVASIDKIADPGSFAASIGFYKLIPAAPALVIATVLPWLELLCGLGLIFGISVRANSLLTFAMLLVFTAGVASALLRGLDISCGCFTQDPGAGKIGWTKLLENSCLILLAALLYIQPGFRWSLDNSSRHRDTI